MDLWFLKQHWGCASADSQVKSYLFIYLQVRTRGLEDSRLEDSKVLCKSENWFIYKNQALTRQQNVLQRRVETVRPDLFKQHNRGLKDPERTEPSPPEEAARTRWTGQNHRGKPGEHKNHNTNISTNKDGDSGLACASLRKTGAWWSKAFQIYNLVMTAALS